MFAVHAKVAGFQESMRERRTLLYHSYNLANIFDNSPEGHAGSAIPSLDLPILSRINKHIALQNSEWQKNVNLLMMKLYHNEGALLWILS